MTEGTDSTSTDTYDIGTILSYFHRWILMFDTVKSTHDFHDIPSRADSSSL